MIKLTKAIGGKRVELDVIFLDGKTVVRYDNFKELRKKGITKKQLAKAGFEIEKQESKLTS